LVTTSAQATATLSEARTLQRVGSTKPRGVDVRIVAATNVDLLERARNGQFREDLYYRLNDVPIEVLPLRQRQGDVALLAQRFVARVAAKYRKAVSGFTPAALEVLERFSWPGNVRQLENLVERLVILCRGDQIDAHLLPAEVRQARETAAVPPSPAAAAPAFAEAGSGLRPIKEVARRAICEALQRTGGNVAEAARVLGMGQATIYRKLKRYNINPRGLAGAPATPLAEVPA
jgi:DNA-binding NtrC family response regulator